MGSLNLSCRWPNSLQHQICHPDFQAKVTQWQFKQSTYYKHKISQNLPECFHRNEAQEFPRTLQKLASLRDTPGHTKHQDLAPLRYRGLSLKIQHFSPLFAGFYKNTSQVVQNIHEFPVWNWNPTAYALSANHCLWEKASSSSMLWNHCVRVHGVQPPGPQITGSWLHLSIGAMALVLSVRMDHECKSQENDTNS